MGTLEQTLSLKFTIFDASFAFDVLQDVKSGNSVQKLSQLMVQRIDKEREEDIPNWWKV